MFSLVTALCKAVQVSERAALTVWTGQESMLITINVLGPGHDDINPRDASIALAEQIIAGAS